MSNNNAAQWEQALIAAIVDFFSQRGNSQIANTIKDAFHISHAPPIDDFLWEWWMLFYPRYLSRSWQIVAPGCSSSNNFETLNSQPPPAFSTPQKTSFSTIKDHLSLAMSVLGIQKSLSELSHEEREMIFNYLIQKHRHDSSFTRGLEKLFIPIGSNSKESASSVEKNLPSSSISCSSSSQAVKNGKIEQLLEKTIDEGKEFSPFPHAFNWNFKSSSAPEESCSLMVESSSSNQLSCLNGISTETLIPLEEILQFPSTPSCRLQLKECIFLPSVACQESSLSSIQVAFGPKGEVYWADSRCVYRFGCERPIVEFKIEISRLIDLFCSELGEIIAIGREKAFIYQLESEILSVLPFGGEEEPLKMANFFQKERNLYILDEGGSLSVFNLETQKLTLLQREIRSISQHEEPEFSFSKTSDCISGSWTSQKERIFLGEECKGTLESPIEGIVNSKWIYSSRVILSLEPFLEEVYRIALPSNANEEERISSLVWCEKNSMMLVGTNRMICLFQVCF